MQSSKIARHPHSRLRLRNEASPPHKAAGSRMMRSLEARSAQAQSSPPEVLARFLREASARMRKMVEATGIKAP